MRRRHSPRFFPVSFPGAVVSKLCRANFLAEARAQNRRSQVGLVV